MSSRDTLDRFRAGRAGIGIVDTSQRELFLTGYTSKWTGLSGLLPKFPATKTERGTTRVSREEMVKRKIISSSRNILIFLNLSRRGDALCRIQPVNDFRSISCARLSVTWTTGCGGAIRTTEATSHDLRQCTTLTVSVRL